MMFPHYSSEAVLQLKVCRRWAAMFANSTAI